ncbi:hypothetical protein IQ273_22020 [Nodosilinea sp. LEGE 07298]|nr:hypothetical protein [Nodosilinea sp. LEGE 07298]
MFNPSRRLAVVTCALTTNPKRVSLPSNVAFEAGLLKRSIVEVGKLTSLQKTQLGFYIGILTEARVVKLLAGIRFLRRLPDERRSPLSLAL